MSDSQKQNGSFEELSFEERARFHQSANEALLEARALHEQYPAPEFEEHYKAASSHLEGLGQSTRENWEELRRSFVDAFTKMKDAAQVSEGEDTGKVS